MKKLLTTSLVLLLLGWVTVQAQPTAVIELVAYSPQEIHDLGMETEPSTGLRTVGLGEVIYPRVMDAEGEAITSVSWTVSGPAGSTAGFGDAAAEETTFRPDVEGEYELAVSITTAAGTADTTKVLIVGTYIGVGIWTNLYDNIRESNCWPCHIVQLEEWLGTEHPTLFKDGIDGIASSHYNEGCIECHTVGYDENPAADNGGFDDVAAANGWTFPATLEEGNWDNLVANFPEVAALGSIQCENCHGPASQHVQNRFDPELMDISMDEGLCGRCHEEAPYHIKNTQWKNSRHGVGVAYASGRSGCADCHSSWGFVAVADEESGLQQTTGGDGKITCQTCHDPHSNANEHQLRTIADVELSNGEVITDGGMGKLCMNCHKSRRDAETYATEYHSHFGPHHSPVVDMLAGTNAIEYGRPIVGSGHLNAVENACVTCHMAAGPGGESPAANMIGEHSFEMSFDNGTPDDPSDDIDNVTACVNCHGPMDSFDDIMAKYDYDDDSDIESVQNEVRGLLDKLALLLPPLDEVEVEVSEDYTPAQLKGAYNYLEVLEDKSFGVHNANYAIEILKASIIDLGGVTGITPDMSGEMPESYELSQNFPNPFNPTTQIRFSLPEEADVKVVIYDAVGREVEVLANSRMNSGSYTLTFNASGLASGVYFYKLTANNFVKVNKMLLVK